MGIAVALGPADQSWKYKVMVVVLSLDASECEHMSITRSNGKESLVVIVNRFLIVCNGLIDKQLGVV